jgi:hypothetical protein
VIIHPTAEYLLTLLKRMVLKGGEVKIPVGLDVDDYPLHVDLSDDGESYTMRLIPIGDGNAGHA